MKIRQRGFSLAEILILMALIPVVLVFLFQALRSTTLLYQGNFDRSSAKQSLVRVRHLLSQALDSSAVDGVHLSADGRLIAIQSLSGISANGQRLWSPKVDLFRLRDGDVLLQTVELVDVGIENSPQNLTSVQLEQLVNTASPVRLLGHDFTQFQFSRNGDQPWIALEMKVRNSGTRTRFALMSSLGR